MRRKRNDQPELPAAESGATTATAERVDEIVENATPVDTTHHVNSAAVAVDIASASQPSSDDPVAQVSVPDRNGELMTYQRYAELLGEMYQRLNVKQSEITKLKGNLKEACEQEKMLNSQILDAIDAFNAKMPLFDQSSEPAVTPDAEAWRAVPIREALAGLPASLYERLEEAEITTMGAYADYCQKNASLVDSGEHPLRKITGIGPKKVEEIQAAEEAFWKLWKERPMVPHEDTANEDKYHFDAGDEDRYGQYKYDYTADGQ